MMTTKEKVVRESIHRLEKEQIEIDSILEATPTADICQVRIDAQLLLETTKGDDRFSSQFLSAMQSLANREKELFALAEKQKNSAVLINRKVEIQFELSDLNRELYGINQRKFIRNEPNTMPVQRISEDGQAPGPAEATKEEQVQRE